MKGASRWTIATTFVWPDVHARSMKAPAFVLGTSELKIQIHPHRRGYVGFRRVGRYGQFHAADQRAYGKRSLAGGRDRGENPGPFRVRRLALNPARIAGGSPFVITLARFRPIFLAKPNSHRTQTFRAPLSFDTTRCMRIKRCSVFLRPAPTPENRRIENTPVLTKSAQPTAFPMMHHIP